MKRILNKKSVSRDKQELNFLIEHLNKVRFLKELKMRPNQLKKVAQKLNYQNSKAKNYLFKYGEEGEDFYIIIEGEVSVWVPVPPEQMIKPLEKFKEKVKNTICNRSASTFPLFQFHIEPFKTESNPAYCTYKDFTCLCAKEAPEELLEDIWRQFQLHRAVSTIEMVENEFISEYNFDIRQSTVW